MAPFIMSTRLLPDTLKGHANRFYDLVDDYGRLLDHFADRLPKPWISLTHERMLEIAYFVGIAIT